MFRHGTPTALSDARGQKRGTEKADENGFFRPARPARRERDSALRNHCGGDAFAFAIYILRRQDGENAGSVQCRQNADVQGNRRNGNGIPFRALQKLAFLCERITVTDDIRAAALRTAKHPRLRSRSAECKRLKGSVIFSKFCAGEMGYDTENFDERYLALTDDLCACLNNVFDSLDNISIFDFSAFYDPCGILARFDTFASAPPETRAAFLQNWENSARRKIWTNTPMRYGSKTTAITAKCRLSK